MIAAENKRDLMRRRKERIDVLEMRRRITEGKPAFEEDEFDDGGPTSPNAGRSMVRKTGLAEEKFGKSVLLFS